MSERVSERVISTPDFGYFSDLRSLLIACRNSQAAPIVRIPSVDPDLVKFVMDSGAAGVMFPFVSDVRDAEAAVCGMKYPPVGRRGVASAIRATDFGTRWQDYFSEANEQSLVVVQIETAEILYGPARGAAMIMLPPPV